MFNAEQDVVSEVEVTDAVSTPVRCWAASSMRRRSLGSENSVDPSLGARAASSHSTAARHRFLPPRDQPWHRPPRVYGDAMPDARPDTAPLLAAIAFASRKHSTQRRKGADASPYINHPIAVAHLLADPGGITDLTTLMAAVLHDTIEDTETTASELDEHFGTTVRQVVEELTDDKCLKKDVRKQLQIDHAPHLSPRAKTIKLADKIANVLDVTDSPPADWSTARRLEYFDWTEKVVAGCRGTNEALEVLYDQTLAMGRAKLTTLATGEHRA